MSRHPSANAGYETAECRRCGHQIGRLTDLDFWLHLTATGLPMPRNGGRGCRSASFIRDGAWDETLSRSWRAQPQPGTEQQH